MIYGIIGGIGYGKTARGVLMLLRAKEKGEKCYSNMHSIKFAEYLTRDQFVNLPKLQGDEKGAVFIDEPYVWFESRGSGTNKKQTKATYAILQSRKKGYDIIYAVQLASTIDLRMRQNTNVEIYAYKKWRYMIADKTGTNVRIKRVYWRNHLWIYKEFDTREIVESEE